MSVVDFNRQANELVRQWQRDSEGMARRLSGAEKSAALAHGHTKSACADALQRLLWKHGMGATSAKPTPGATR